MAGDLEAGVDLGMYLQQQGVLGLQGRVIMVVMAAVHPKLGPLLDQAAVVVAHPLLVLPGQVVQRERAVTGPHQVSLVLP
jgi:hypothetical protein